MTGAARGDGWIAVAAAATIVASIAGWAVARRWPDSIRAGRHPELASADPELVRQIRSYLGKDGRIGGPELESTLDKEPAAALSATLDRDPAASAPAALRALIEHFGAPSSVETSTWVIGDDIQRPVSVWLRDHPTPATDRALLRIVANRDERAELRDSAVIALCRPGNAAAMDALLRVASDESESQSRRVQILQRWWKIGSPPPGGARALLYVTRPRISQPAAASLALAGDVEAPSLVLSGMRDALDSTSDDATGWMCASAMQRIVGDEDLRARLDVVKSWFWEERRTAHVGGATKHTKEEVVAVTDEVGQWLAAHGEEFGTDYERGRREYLGGERRVRELWHDSMERVVEAGDDVDLAAALLLPTYPSGHGAELLEAADRLARLVRADAGSDPTPEAWIAALSRRLLGGRRHLDSPSSPSELGYVMWVGFGDDVGLSSLVLAVADRLGLPITAVATPGHVLVRWDDGKIRRNIECTERGAEYDDAWYAARVGTPVPVSRRRFVAIAIARRARLSDSWGQGGRAVHWADWAVKIAPDEPLARMERARITAVWRIGDASVALEDVRAARAARPLSATECAVAATVHAGVRQFDEALAAADAGLALAPERIELALCRARALAGLRLFDEARAVVDAAAARAPRHPGVRAVRVMIRFAEGDANWREGLAGLSDDPAKEPHAHLDLAAALLEGVTKDAQASPRDAKAVLDLLAGFEARGPTPRNFSYDVAQPPDLSRIWENAESVRRLLRVYYFLRVRCCQALNDEPGAAAAQAALAKIDAR